jgi:hypothetical protein
VLVDGETYLIYPSGWYELERGCAAGTEAEEEVEEDGDSATGTGAKEEVKEEEEAEEKEAEEEAEEEWEEEWERDDDDDPIPAPWWEKVDEEVVVDHDLQLEIDHRLEVVDRVSSLKRQKSELERDGRYYRSHVVLQKIRREVDALLAKESISFKKWEKSKEKAREKQGRNKMRSWADQTEEENQEEDERTKRLKPWTMDDVEEARKRRAVPTHKVDLEESDAEESDAEESNAGAAGTVSASSCGAVPQALCTVEQWHRHLLQHGMETGLARRCAGVFFKAKWTPDYFTEMKQVEDDCWRLKLDTDKVFKALTDSPTFTSTSECWDYRGLHSTTPEGAIGIIQDRQVRGTRMGDLRGVYCVATVNPKTTGDMITLFRGARKHGHNLAKVIYEISCCTRDNHKPLSSGGVEKETKELVHNKVVHMKTTTTSRWVIDERWAQLIAIWLEPTAFQDADGIQSFTL